jgi:N-acetylglutamate synthase-like GNAT family acetyltransferase
MTTPALPPLRRALEIAHFARRQRGTRFVAVLGGTVPLSRLLLDVQLVAAYGLLGVIVARRSALDTGSLASLAAEGVPLTACRPDPVALQAVFERQQLPVVLVDAPKSPALGLLERIAGRVAQAIQARRLILIRTRSAAVYPRSHLLAAEAAGLHAAVPPAQQAELRYVADRLADGIAGVVLLPAVAGSLFEELFTHHGAGVLIGDPTDEAIRPATLADAADIGLLLKAEMQRGVVRAADDRAIAASVHQHLVYTMDGLVVGTARLAPHGDWAEMSRFATLPRYRGRGRARQLGEALIKRGIELGYRHLFALSVDARMWAFFESLGFSSIERGALPASWQAGYDFDRPSRAFHRVIDPAAAQSTTKP